MTSVSCSILTEAAAAPAPAYLLLGEILRPHGVLGELRMRPRTGYPEQLAARERVFLGRGPHDLAARAYQLVGLRWHGRYALLTLAGIADRNAADALRGLFVMAPLAEAVPLEEGEFYIFQIIGARVETAEGEALGTLVDVLETGANDVYILRGSAYGEVLLPVTEETVVETDIAARRVVVAPPAGLLPPCPS